jgi:hypothetical protein
MTSPFAPRHSRNCPRSPRQAGGELLIGWLILGLLATQPATAWAAPQPEIDLRWEAPQGCPQESDVRDRIQNLLGSTRQTSPLRAEGTITKTERGFRLDLVVHVRDLAGPRTIESGACEELAGAAAVEIALLVHSGEAPSEPGRPGTSPRTSPSARGSESSASHSDASDARPSQGPNDASASASARTSNGANAESKPEVAEQVAREEKPLPTHEASYEASYEASHEASHEASVDEPPRTRHVMVQLPVLDLGFGPLPKSSRGIGLGLGLEYAGWQSQLKGVFWEGQSIPAPGFPGYGADVGRVGAAFWGCREFRGDWIGLSPCVTVGVERVSATGTGPNIVQKSQSALGMTAGAGVQGRIFLASWFRLLLAVGGQVELSRPQISVSGARPGAFLEPYRFDVYEFAPAALSVSVGLEWML